MAQVDMKALREKLRSEAQKNTTQSNDNAGYRFWDIKPGEQAVTRFLPDGDADNSFFWRERGMINLEFDGIIGQDTGGKPIKVSVPCMEMYGKTCPVISEARKFYKEGKDELGQKYWKKKSYVFQGFVRSNPLAEDVVPENPIRRFVINPSIYKIVYTYIMDEDSEYSPTDYENGCDFRIIKTQNGQYADYATSSFARKNTALTNDEIDAIDKFGLFNLSDFLPKEPDADAIRIIEEMFEASLNGDAYDPSRFSNYYRPYELQLDSVTNVNEDTKGTHAKEVEKVEAESAENTSTSSKPTPQELLARIRRNG